jgi:ArsR family transcriptional regulator
MLNTQPIRPKDVVYGAFADVTKALSNPGCLELLDLLVQGPREVEALAAGVGRPLAATSQHLQVLKRARLVDTRRRGTHVEYRLAPGVALAFVALRRLAEDRSPALRVAKADLHGDAADTIAPDALRALLARGEAVLLDVRPAEEYAHAHLPGALSIPSDELEARLDEIPPVPLVVAVCRGPYCTFAARAVSLLRRRGRDAVRFEQGVADWVLDGHALHAGPMP